MPLSVGVEVEAIILKYRSPLPSRDYARLELVAKALEAGGLSARVFLPSSTRDIPDFSVWNVVMDVTIEEATSGSDASENTITERFGVEVVSPIFFTEMNTWAGQIRSAMQAVSLAFTWKANRSTGLHVHVGRGREDQFTLPQLKRLAIMVVRFEGKLPSSPMTAFRMTTHQMRWTLCTPRTVSLGMITSCQIATMLLWIAILFWNATP